MLACLSFVRQFDMCAISIRIIVAFICGSIIGLEREIKRRPAGFRTHILICLGAAITTLTSQYIVLSLNLYTDIARLGAQVVSGIGFIGAGAIIVTKSRKIKGLTTAAGLWTTAIIGLVCGAGYIECAVFSSLMIMFAEIVLSKLEYRISRNTVSIQIYVEYNNSDALEKIIQLFSSKRISINDLQITRSNYAEEIYYCALIQIQGNTKYIKEHLFDDLRSISYVKIVDEL